MQWSCAGALALIGWFGAANAAPVAPPALVPAEIHSYATATLKPMIDVSGCPTTSLAAWPAGMVRRCVYTVKDTSATDARSYTTIVWLADPTRSRAAQWAWSACLKAQPAAPIPCAKAVVDQMRRIASAAHFPVAGLYYEDLIGKDGRYEAYFFREGVTTRLEGYELLNGSRWPDADEDGAALAEKVAVAAVKSMKTGMARPVAVTPGAYRSASGDAAAPTDVSDAKGAEAWHAVVRRLTIAALSGPEAGSENELVTAWACTELQSEVKPSVCFHR